MEQVIKDRINHLSKELRLPTFRNQFEIMASEAAEEDLVYEEYLLNLMEQEYLTRIENRKKASIRLAGFSEKLYLSDLNKDELPSEAAEKLSVLQRLDFIANSQNIIMSGNPGTGKTHMAIGLGIKACQQGYRVFYTTISRLLTQIRESRSEKTLRTLEGRFEKFDLVICDEFGYISFDKQGAELLFSHLSLRTGRKSTIITTNLSFDRWDEIFRDPVLTAAMVDRLTHKAHIINMNGKSYRMKDTQRMSKTKKL